MAENEDGAYEGGEGDYGYDEGAYEGGEEGYGEYGTGGDGGYDAYQGDNQYGGYEEGGYDGGDGDTSQITYDVDENAANAQPAITLCWTKALYDFDGQTEVELSFKAGNIIGVADPDPNSEWWFGELYGTEARGSFPQNYVDLGPDGLGASSPEFAAQFGVESSEQAGDGQGGEEEERGGNEGGDQVISKKQKLRDDMNNLKDRLAQLQERKKALKGEIEEIKEEKANLTSEIVAIEKVSDMLSVRSDLWKAILAIETEGKSYASLELISQSLSSELTSLREIIQPALAGVGVPLLEEYSKSFHKTLGDMLAKSAEDQKILESAKASRIQFLEKALAAEMLLEGIQ